MIEAPCCDRLGLPLAIDTGGILLSPEAIANPPEFQRARAALRYDDGARILTRRFKYGDQLELAGMMARMMIRAGRDLLKQADIIVPVPLYRRRLWSRRFNQSAVLAAEVARLSGLPWDAFILERRRHTRPQVGLSRPERAANLHGALRITEQGAARLTGKRVLLVDDVMTTGATANACARAMLEAGAAQVDVLTFARAVVTD